MENDTHVLMATIPQRQKRMRDIIEILYPQIDHIHIVFNNFESIPQWVYEFPKIDPLLNTPDKHTSNAVWLFMKNIRGYVFTCDDDILYPKDYAQQMIKSLNKYHNRIVLTMYGETAPRPFKKYNKGVKAIGFSKALDIDTPVDICGVGCALFHTDCLYPLLEDFPDMYSRDLWFTILANKNKIPIIRKHSPHKWLNFYESENTPAIKNIWRKDPELTKRRNQVWCDILVPLMNANKIRGVS